MSAKHPIIAITGSSGAGTTTVMRTFQHVFRREKLNAAFVEGDSFHRYDRKEMRAQLAAAAEKGNHNFSHFGADANLLAELEALFKTYGATGGGKLRRYLHDADEAAPLQAGAGHVHAVGRPAREYRPAVLRGPARRGADRRRRRRPPRRSAGRRGPDHQSRMDPEAAPRQEPARLFAGSGGRHHPAPDARLRELHRAAVRAHARQLPARRRSSTRRIRSSRRTSPPPTRACW